MAEKLAEFDWGKPKRGRPAKYPWKKWFDGEIYKLEHGIDFDISVKSFRNSMKAAEKRHGVRVRSMSLEKGQILVIQARKED